MDAKFEIRDASGTVVFSRANRSFRYLLAVPTGTTDGSQSIVGLSSGTPVILTSNRSDGYQPQASIVGSSVSWTFNGADTGDRVPADLLIGVY